ncbi:hypothetical protein AVEN_145844-1 [Araneus ventricosus]|uniref:Uncharacterized protein n=1 Tax=Araneus ventricosus TaxID=182803 RepID=A0A4Y2UUZ8_ARAVE|nr:hypothetical protein AVEN_145844-1 [Araneus ventricosus]
MPIDGVIGESSQPFLFDLWPWLSHIPRHCESIVCAIVKFRAGSTTIALIAVREMKHLRKFAAKLPHKVCHEKQISRKIKLAASVHSIWVTPLFQKVCPSPSMLFRRRPCLCGLGSLVSV